MRVVCRLRPPRDGDNGREAPVPLVFTSNAVYTFESGPRHSAYGRFDSTLGPHATQDETFGACCHGLIDDCLRGVSATVLAYGASGAGKTHSLVGAVTTAQCAAATTLEKPRAAAQAAAIPQRSATAALRVQHTEQYSIPDT